MAPILQSLIRGPSLVALFLLNIRQEACETEQLSQNPRATRNVLIPDFSEYSQCDMFLFCLGFFFFFLTSHKHVTKEIIFSLFRS